ncbi:MAG TPA: nucleotidyltransferase domain-containing protein [Clostridiales bacterium]|nr:nucleotidyltransferase domain-containing protein [Clostridiales bacterium]
METIDTIQNKLKPIFLKEPIKKAVLFGSYAKGSFTESSDIDLVIDSEGLLLGLDFFRVLDEIVQTLNMDVDLFEVAEIVNGSPMEKTIQQEGITIYERKVA